MSFATDRSVEITISGKVVGVDFRNWAQRTATRLALGGWVRNNTDQTVSIAAEGPIDAVDSFIELIRRGPEGATVEGLDVREMPEAHGYAGFQVEY
ncbi:MAG: acylphosphatase [Patescibacteria group bacterium]